MTCDHAATRASLAAFFGSTRLLGGQDLGDGQWALLGICTGCDTTLAIQIAEPRGTAVHGECGATDDSSRTVCARDSGHDGGHAGTPPGKPLATLAWTEPDEPPVRSRYGFDAGKVARHLEDIEETADEHARRVIK